MEAKEFRIGNSVKISGSHDIVSIASIARIWFQPKFMGKACTRRLVSDIIPVWIDEDILLKCGFEKDKDKRISGNYSIFISTFEFYFCFGNGICEFYLNRTDNIKIKYLHQLQNLYFSLTGKELEVIL